MDSSFQAPLFSVWYSLNFNLTFLNLVPLVKVKKAILHVLVRKIYPLPFKVSKNRYYTRDTRPTYVPYTHENE